MYIIIATAPRSYRDVITGALRLLRPHVITIALEPEGLDEGVRRWQPDFVVCSALHPVLQGHVRAWILLYPNGDRSVTLHLADAETTRDDLDFDHLLALVDQMVQDGSSSQRLLTIDKEQEAAVALPRNRPNF